MPAPSFAAVVPRRWAPAEPQGDNRAADAARSAIAATRMDDGIRGARSVLVNVSGSRKLRLAELDAVAETVLAATGRETNLIFGVGVRPKLADELQVTIVATRGGAGGIAAGDRHRRGRDGSGGNNA